MVTRSSRPMMEDPYLLHPLMAGQGGQDIAEVCGIYSGSCVAV